MTMRDDLPDGYGGVSRPADATPPAPGGSGRVGSAGGAGGPWGVGGPWGAVRDEPAPPAPPPASPAVPARAPNPFADWLDGSADGRSPAGRSVDAARPMDRLRAWWAGRRRVEMLSPAAPGGSSFGGHPGGSSLGAPPGLAADPARTARRWLWVRRGLAAGLALLILIIAWLALTAPLSKSLQPVAPRAITLLSADGQPIARHGATVDKPVDARTLPPHVVQAFLATEDRRFYTHWGIDPRGLARAAWANVSGGGVSQGGSTITQQLAKISYLSADRTVSRKARELLIAFWMEAWLDKNAILSRYLSNAYFGDNVYGLRAASLHYFYRQPERLTLSQATMLAGLVKAPSRLAPTRNLDLARKRQKVVLIAMVDAGYLTAQEARRVAPAVVDRRPGPALPSGTYFADWAMREARDSLDSDSTATRVRTTLDARLQAIARRVVAGAGPSGTQVALVAMRPDGEVVAMIGGRDYRKSAFNRATQGRRQPGSTFKLPVYLAALRAGLDPDDQIADQPIVTGDYRPANAGGRYAGSLTLTEAFARSSNVAAVRLYTQVGPDAVATAARDLGITTPLPRNASAALGTGGVPLIDMVAAYAAVAANYGPVDPHAIKRAEAGWLDRLTDGRSSLTAREHRALLAMLRRAIDTGTGVNARLGIPAYGKTGTTQDGRDALFIGFAGDLVVGVWMGRDDNKPVDGLTGGGAPARVWRDFMTAAVPGAARRAPAPAPTPQRAPERPRLPFPLPPILDDVPDVPLPDGGLPDRGVRVGQDGGVDLGTTIGGVDVGVSIGQDGIRVREPDPAQVEEQLRRGAERAIEERRRAEERAEPAP